MYVWILITKAASKDNNPKIRCFLLFDLFMLIKRH